MLSRLEADTQDAQKERELLSNWAFSNSAATDQTHKHTRADVKYRPPTKSGSVLADEPAVIGEERGKADWEHGGREEEEQDVELRLSVWEAILRGKQHVNTKLHKHSPVGEIWVLRRIWETSTQLP